LFERSGEELAAVDNGTCDVGEFSVSAAGVGAEEFEGLLLVDVVAFHEDAFGAFDERAAGEGPFQVLELGEAAKDDVDRALQLFGLTVRDVGEDAAFGGFVDELAVIGLEDRDYGAGGLADDLVDQVERVLAAFAEADQGDVGAFAGGQSGDVFDLDRAGDHLVSEARDDRGHLVQSAGPLVGDQHPEMVGIRKVAHSRHPPTRPILPSRQRVDRGHGWGRWSAGWAGGRGESRTVRRAGDAGFCAGATAAAGPGSGGMLAVCRLEPLVDGGLGPNTRPA